MSQQPDSEDILRKSLDAIDAVRRRVFLGGYAAVASTLAAFVWLRHVSRTSADLDGVLMAAVLALTCVIAWSTFALAIFITRMTKRVLRAIDVAVNSSSR